MEAALVSDATGVMKPVLSKLADLLKGQYTKHKGMRKKIKFLHDELSAMAATLETLEMLADEGQLSPQDREWRDALRELSYDVEDCIDAFTTRVAHERDGRSGFEQLVDQLKKLKTFHKTANEIQELQIRVKEMSDRHNRFLDQRKKLKPFDGLPLDNNDRTLEDYNIHNGSTLHLALVPLGADCPLEEQQSKMVMDQIRVSSLTAWEMLKRLIQNQIIRLRIVCGTSITTDQLEQQQKRWANYSLKVFMFTVTIFLAYLVSGSTSTSAVNMLFLVAIGAASIADAVLFQMMPPKWGSALVYLLWFLLVLLSYLLLVSFNKYYGFAIFPMALLIVAALLHRKIQPGVWQQQSNEEANQLIENADRDVDLENAHHDTDDEDSQHFDKIFDLSSGIANCGGLITVVFGHYMVGPANAVGFLFLYTIALGLSLMMVTTVRTVPLTVTRYLAMMLKVLLVTTLITALSHGVRRSKE